MLLACFKEIFHVKLFRLGSGLNRLPFSLIPGYVINIGAQFWAWQNKIMIAPSPFTFVSTSAV